MGFKCGIVGLPNVGKSTLFNALTQTAAAQAANYPFCTIEPNVGEVAVPDPRLDALAKLAKSVQIVPTRLTFVDIAGLVRGASKGEGLGNQFLGNIREVDAIAHVVRCFEDTDVTHVEGRIDPIADIETVETELMLADLESLEKRVPNFAKKAAQGDKEAKIAASVLGQALDLLRDGKPARLTEPKDDEEARVFGQAQLLRLLLQQVAGIDLIGRVIGDADDAHRRFVIVEQNPPHRLHVHQGVIPGHETVTEADAVLAVLTSRGLRHAAAPAAGLGVREVVHETRLRRAALCAPGRSSA